jgi:alkanesulfonate monooxygenase SsuD/methylene tetrahydromethanopterin reductase-like flavin-dependent oxidoreductase (luciferase family)
LVGSPEEVVDRLVATSRALKTDVNLVYQEIDGQPAGEYRVIVELIRDKVLPKLS